jgi:uncharacterized protein
MQARTETTEASNSACCQQCVFCERIRALTTVKLTMKRNTLFYWFGGLCLCLGWASVTLRAERVSDIKPTGYVMDLAGVIQPQTKTQLEAMCTELEQKTGAQLAIVTVKSLEGEEAAPYANEVYKHLGVGAKKQDTGVLLLVAPNERKYWTEVGYGLEPVINDARAGDAGRLMVPYFRRGDYSGGIAAAAWQLAKYVADDKGVTLTGMPQMRPVRQQEEDHGGLWIWIILGIVFFAILASSGRSSPGGGGGGGLGAGWVIGSILGSMGGGRRGGGWGGSSGGWGGSGGWDGGGGFGGFGGGSSGGGGAGGSW